MHEQFLLGNKVWVARQALKKLKHTGILRGYVNDLTSLMLDIQDMFEEDKLCNFLIGLQQWAQIEVRRLRVKDLALAIVMVSPWWIIGIPLRSRERRPNLGQRRSLRGNQGEYHLGASRWGYKKGLAVWWAK